MNKKRLLYMLFLGFVMIAGCSKDDQGEETYGYEVTCDYCDIRYLNEFNTYVHVQEHRNQWKKEFRGISEMYITVNSKSNSSDIIYVYVLKNGSRISTHSGEGSVTASHKVPSSGSSRPVSGICGAPTQKGAPCQRKVSGGGRCWQHK
ncbi:hypothetical protein H8B06_19100 [Sphingobacterium sp. DN00404]|uniref:C2H2-type domain-containing protein n=1 Tax=Sphingobacterium micropteri TaxID=2763501 RepID=A0ABR7YUH3_9SPHI|nr:hypothetical protein [Sphingobacterium micropteri]MBD1434937.1 hypothetical protein [Sphingobacterium micropteri]